MSTGSLAVVISQTPNRFRGLETIGKIFFIVDLVLFLGFCTAISIRFSMQPKVLPRSMHHPPEALFFGTFWVSVALILSCTQQYGVPVCGPWLVTALEVCFWIYAGCCMCVAVFQYTTLFVEEKLPVSNALPAWVFPIYPFLVIGPLASLLLPYQPAEAAFCIWIGGVAFQGLAWTVSMFMYTIYVMRLMSSTVPPPPTRPGMFVGVGPAGYTASALVSLGTQAPNVVPQNLFNITTVPVADVLKIMGIISGIFIFLVSFWFFALTVVAIIGGLRRMSFTLNWWAFIFPNSGMTLAIIQIGNALQSDGIKAVASALTILLVIAWLVVAVANVRAVMKKQIMWEGKDEDVNILKDSEV